MRIVCLWIVSNNDLTETGVLVSFPLFSAALICVCVYFLCLYASPAFARCVLRVPTCTVHSSWRRQTVRTRYACHTHEMRTRAGIISGLQSPSVAIAEVPTLCFRSMQRCSMCLPFNTPTRLHVPVTPFHIPVIYLSHLVIYLPHLSHLFMYLSHLSMYLSHLFGTCHTSSSTH